MASSILLVILGVTAGTLSGLMGIGGGLIIIPALIYGWGLSPHQAQGTTLTLLVPPIGILAAYVYWKAGHVNVPIVILVGLGFVFGALIGAKLAVGLPDDLLRKTFGTVMLIVGIQMIFFK